MKVLPEKITRRTRLHIYINLACLLVLVFSACCVPRKEENPAPAVKVFQQFSYSESPLLAAQVAQGQLEAVQERLPENPLLVQPETQVGSYGGEWTVGIIGNGDQELIFNSIGYENLVRWDTRWTRIIANVAQTVDVNENATLFRFTLRKGMRWSDGEPFSARDVRFWYEDVLMNSELGTKLPAWMLTHNQMPSIETPDEQTVIFRFAGTNGLFLQHLAQSEGAELTGYPAHYLKQFHQKYNSPENLKILMQKSGVKTWVDLFRLKAGTPGDIHDPTRWQNPDLPTLYAWTLETPYYEDTQQVTARRNPYYWKIDPTGQQLPYLDRVVFTQVNTQTALVKMAMQGQIDMQEYHLSAYTYQTALNSNAATGNYHFFKTISANSNLMSIHLNLNHPDPVLRALFQDRNFRIGLSHSIDRQRILQNMLVDSSPYQVAPLLESPLAHPLMGTQYLQYDINRANGHLDLTGCSQRDADGNRLRSDGQSLAFTVEIPAGGPSSMDWFKIMSLVQEDWRKVGINVQISLKPYEKFYSEATRAQHDAIVWHGLGGLDGLINPGHFFPYNEESFFAPAWGRWNVNPADPLAQPPPQFAQKQMTLYYHLTQEADPVEQTRLMNQILAISSEQFYVIGIARPAPSQGVVRNHFLNVPSVMTFSVAYPNPASSNPCQFFIAPE